MYDNAYNETQLLADHTTFIKEVAVAQPPENLSCLLSMLRARGMLLLCPITWPIFPQALIDGPFFFP